VAVPAPVPEKPETRGGVCVRFDPRFAELWEKGRIPVKVEAAKEGGTSVWKWLDRARVTKLPAVCVVTPEQAIDLFEALADSGAARRGEMELSVASTPASRIRVRLEPRDDGDFRLTPFARQGSDQQWLRAAGRTWVFFRERGLLEPVRSAPPGGEALYGKLLDGEAVTVPAGLLLAGLNGWHECLEFLSEPGKGIVVRPGSPKFRARFEGSFNALSGVVTVAYDAIAFRLGAAPAAGSFPFRAADGSFVTRNAMAERLAAVRLEEFGFSGPDGDGQFQLRGEKEVGRFYARGYPELSRVWEVELGERFHHVTRQVDVIRPRMVERGSDANWLGFAITYTGTGGVEISRQEIQKLLAKGQSKVQLPGGRTAYIDLDACAEADEVIFDAQPRQEDGLFRVRASQAGFLRTAFRSGESAATGPVDLTALGELASLLRDYQRDGIRWLVQQWQGPAGAGLLADEMGLGKTLQSLAAAELLWQEQDGGKSWSSPRPHCSTIGIRKPRGFFRDAAATSSTAANVGRRRRRSIGRIC